MIHAICLNPTIDRTYYINGYYPGNQYKGLTPHICPGGKGINVAKVCALMGTPVTLYGFVGKENSKQLLDALSQTNITLELLSVPGYTRTSINIVDNHNHRETELMEIGPYVDPEASRQLLERLQTRLAPGHLVICSGISTPGVPEDFYVQISKVCQKAQAKCLLDTNGQNLKDSITGHFFMVKPNHQELCELFNIDPTYNVETLRALAGKLMSYTEWVLASMGDKGGLLVGKDECYLAQVPEVPVKSAIGCGDSSVAGFAIAIQQGASPEDALRLALACGTANAMTEGAGVLKKEDAEQLIEKITVMKLFK